ncbi:hypothetical protein WJX72_004757 [[Myrmecia] bisecta]|uniref:R3H-associated N-terminal domain-containing protein n=1 Tax=[Myrmecia] bisecta TaxID=41462 RepID=A0AAW1PTK8_9CHLO
MEAVLRVGRERRRRFLNDKLLRDMAGALTAPDMEALFKPVPFGETHTTPLTEAAAPENQAIWDLFRNIDMDRQQKVLQKWEAHIQASRQSEAPAGPPPRTSAALTALKCWAGIQRKARDALKKACAINVDDMEQLVLAFLEEGDSEGELVLELTNGFQRLQAHGLAEFHNLVCNSREGADGAVRVTSMRFRRGVDCHGPPEITCADILLALEEHPTGGVNPEVLRKYVAAHLHGQDSSSDASFVVV